MLQTSELVASAQGRGVQGSDDSGLCASVGAVASEDVGTAAARWRCLACAQDNVGAFVPSSEATAAAFPGDAGVAVPDKGETDFDGCCATVAAAVCCTVIAARKEGGDAGKPPPAVVATGGADGIAATMAAEYGGGGGNIGPPP